MLEFREDDPFPLCPPLVPEQYADAKRHSVAVDQWLGLDVDSVEKSLRDPGDGEQRWIATHPSIFLTPYVELRAWLEYLALAPGERVVDLGAAPGGWTQIAVERVGRGGQVVAVDYPDSDGPGAQVTVRMRLRAKFANRVYADATAQVHGSGLLGSKVIAIQPGSTRPNIRVRRCGS